MADFFESDDSAVGELHDGTHVIRFPFGLPGSESANQFRLRVEPADCPFLWLQGLEGRERSFRVIPPELITPGYHPDLSHQDAELLGLHDWNDALVLNVVTVRQGVGTVNLREPIVINRHTLIGKQVQLTNATNFESQHPLRGFGRLFFDAPDQS